jgi:hypothetical protein
MPHCIKRRLSLTGTAQRFAATKVNTASEFQITQQEGFVISAMA